MIAVVFQDVNILAMTVEENITLGHARGDKEALWHCLNQVGLGNKIKQFPKQLRQPLLKIIEEDGTELSGGENQKLAIARALYKQGKMVILDEPTAALDALAEAEIYQEMNELVGHKTAIYISHRLSSTKFCESYRLVCGWQSNRYGTMMNHGFAGRLLSHVCDARQITIKSEQGGNYYEIVANIKLFLKLAYHVSPSYLWLLVANALLMSARISNVILPNTSLMTLGWTRRSVVAWEVCLGGTCSRWLEKTSNDSEKFVMTWMQHRMQEEMANRICGSV